MTAPFSTCGACRGQLAPEDYFCACCGTQARSPERSRLRPRERVLKVFHCHSCGASMSFSPREGALACAFCDSIDLAPTSQPVTLEPERVVPFAVDQEKAEELTSKWLGARWWSPSDLAQRARVEDLQPLEIPCWVFSAVTESIWAADSSQTPTGSKGEWAPRSGEHQGRYRDLYVVASGVLGLDEIRGLLPYDLSLSTTEPPSAAPPCTREPFAFGRKYARPLARDQLRDLVRADCRQLVPGRCRNLHVELRVTQMSSEAVVVPVWCIAYRYRGELFRILINGSTGKVSGTAPLSWARIALAVSSVLTLMLLAAWIWNH